MWNKLCSGYHSPEFVWKQCNSQRIWWVIHCHYFSLGFPGGTNGKEPSSQCRRYKGLVPGLGRSPGEGHYNTLQNSSLENSMDRGAWQATVHRATKSWTWPKRLCMHAYIIFRMLYLTIWYWQNCQSKRKNCTVFKMQSHLLNFYNVHISEP